MNETILSSSQFLIFGAIALVGFIVVGASFLFGGHDHEVDHDHDHDGDGHDHGADGHETPTVSFFSPKVLATFALGFGGAGAIATAYGKSGGVSVLYGLGVGFAIGLIALLMMRAFYSQQASSSLQPGDAVGKTGEVTIEIPQGGTGEVFLALRGTSSTFLAKSKSGARVPKGTMVKVAQDLGGQLLVEPAV